MNAIFDGRVRPYDASDCAWLCVSDLCIRKRHLSKGDSMTDERERLPPTNTSRRRLCPMHHPLPRPKLRRRLGRRRRRILPLRRQKMAAPTVPIPPRPRRPMHRRIVPMRQPHLPTPHMVHVKRRLHHPRLTQPMRPKPAPKHSPGLA